MLMKRNHFMYLHHYWIQIKREKINFINGACRRRLDEKWTHQGLMTNFPNHKNNDCPYVTLISFKTNKISIELWFKLQYK